VQWADSYPARTGRRPDLLKVIAVLQGTGISFDSIMAEIGRSITEQVGQIARDAASAASMDTSHNDPLRCLRLYRLTACLQRYADRPRLHRTPRQG
jgi:hypothetical protein